MTGAGWATDIHEVRDPGGVCRGDRFARRSQIDVEELLRFRRRWPRHADELKNGVARRDRLDERPSVEWIADDDLAAARGFRYRAGAHQRRNAMAAVQQNRNDALAYVPRGSCDKHSRRHG
jgi:hypothetical protein